MYYFPVLLYSVFPRFKIDFVCFMIRIEALFHAGGVACRRGVDFQGVFAFASK
jgi:hypothetical protein